MIKGTLSLIVAAALAQQGSAQIAESTPGTYLCEAAAGQYVSTDVSDFFADSPSTAVRISFVTADHHDRLPPNAGMIFHLDNGTTASMRVIAPRDNPRTLWVTMLPPGSNEAVVMAVIRRSRVVEISATIARGAIFTRAGNERGQIYVGDAGLASREIVCASGRFEIELTRNPRPPRPY